MNLLNISEKDIEILDLIVMTNKVITIQSNGTARVQIDANNTSIVPTAIGKRMQ